MSRLMMCNMTTNFDICFFQLYVYKYFLVCRHARLSSIGDVVSNKAPRFPLSCLGCFV